MASLGHGGNAKEISRNRGLNYDDIIDFSANINPLGMPESAKKAIIDNMDLIEKYPDITYFELKNSIKNFENEKIIDEESKIKNEDIILGNGAAEVLFNVVKAVCPQKVLIPAPTFSEYEEAVNAAGGNANLYYLKEENNFMISEDILEYINNDLDMIFICNPNNPTGIITEKQLLKKILDKSLKNNVSVVLDESFLDFKRDNHSMIEDLKLYENLIIIKSLTKFFAIPGIRVGYALSKNRSLIEKVDTITPAWNINILGEYAVKSSLIDKEYIEETIEFMEKEKDYMYNELKEIKNLTVYEPSVNFILFKVNCDIDLKDRLLEKNILIRSCGNYHGLDKTYYRIAVKKHEENIEIIRMIKEIIHF